MPEQTLDNAVGNLASVAEAALEPIVVSKLDAFAARGHAIIAENLARARSLANTYPAVGVMLPAIEATLHDLFAHMLAGPYVDAPAPPVSRDETRDTVRLADGTTIPAPHLTPETLEAIGEAGVAAKDAEKPSPELPPVEPALSSFPPVRDDKVPAPEAPPAA